MSSIDANRHDGSPHPQSHVKSPGFKGPDAHSGKTRTLRSHPYTLPRGKFLIHLFKNFKARLAIITKHGYKPQGSQSPTKNRNMK